MLLRSANNSCRLESTSTEQKKVRDNHTHTHTNKISRQLRDRDRDRESHWIVTAKHRHSIVIVAFILYMWHDFRAWFALNRIIINGCVYIFFEFSEIRWNADSMRNSFRCCCYHFEIALIECLMTALALKCSEQNNRINFQSKMDHWILVCIF